jgi:hypothetical protein
MCRANVAPEARSAVADLLDTLAHVLAAREGVGRDEVAIGAVDLGPAAADGVY